MIILDIELCFKSFICIVIKTVSVTAVWSKEKHGKERGLEEPGRTREDRGAPGHRQRRQDEVVVLAPLCSRKLGGASLSCGQQTPLIKRLSNRKGGNDPERGFHLRVTKASRAKPRRRWHLPLGPCPRTLAQWWQGQLPALCLRSPSGCPGRDGVFSRVPGFWQSKEAILEGRIK